VPSRADSRAELDSLISRLVDRPSSSLYKDGDGPSRKGSRPNSVLSASQLSGENAEPFSPPVRMVSQSIATQTEASGPIVPEPAPAPAPEPKKETVTYSKAVQTDDLPEYPSVTTNGAQDIDDVPSSPSKRLSRKERERDEEIRERIRREIEEELQAAQEEANGTNAAASSSQLRYPLRTLNDDELNAVTASDDFLDFVEKSSKVIERALDEEYDILADYELGGVNAEDEDDDEFGNKRRGIKEITQFYDERWSKKRTISDLSFSPKVKHHLILVSSSIAC
jgi:dynein intermediate chain, cytosolic